MWSIKPQNRKGEQVESKWCHHIPVKRDGRTEIMGLKPENGWASVHLAYRCRNGDEDLCKVHKTASGNYVFHHPVGMERVTFRDKFINPLAPTYKESAVTFSTQSASKMLEYIVKVTRAEAIAKRVMELLEDLTVPQPR